MSEVLADWGDVPWLEGTPWLNDEPTTEDIEDIYYRPISEKEQICDKCRIPKPCWC